MAELPQEFFKRIEDACRLAEEKAYQQGRADKYQEITSDYMLLTENQVEEIRADAIDEFARAYEQVELIGCVCCEHLYDDVHCWKCVAEQLKEKKND